MAEKKSSGTESSAIGVTVAGVVPQEHFLYVQSPTDGGGGAEAFERRESGGAARLARLLNTVFERARSGGSRAVQVVAPVEPPEQDGDGAAGHAFFLLNPVPFAEAAGGASTGGGSRSFAWRIASSFGAGRAGDSRDVPAGTLVFGAPPFGPPPPLEKGPPPRIVVLRDDGDEFRDGAHAERRGLPGPTQPAPDWVVLEARTPLGRGDLWSELVERFSDRLVAIVDADDLRRSCVTLSRGISWELTVEEFVAGLRDNPELRELQRARHVVVTLGRDGALWIDQSDRQHPDMTLVCDPGCAEGEGDGDDASLVHDGAICLVAAIVRDLVDSLDSPRLDLRDALASGLGAMRDLAEAGHGLATALAPAGWPVERIAARLVEPTGAFANWPIAWPVARPNGTLADHPWRFAPASQMPVVYGGRPQLLGLARLVVTHGPRVIERLAHARFGGLLTTDRPEIETLRTVRRLFREYRDGPLGAPPLALGAFGPPGSGRTFGLHAVADETFGRDAWLEFNLAQFHDAADLNGAFHEIQEAVLSGRTPVVCWDEFDAQEYAWLPSLLGPLEDGTFQEGQWHRSLGKCVFVFAAGSCHASEEFGPPESDREAMRCFQARRGPEFQSRLNACYDVLGVNQRTKPPSDRSSPSAERVLDHDDVEFPLRRAILMRGRLTEDRDEIIDFDPDLLEAMLRTPKYKRGVRSVLELTARLRRAGGAGIRRATLPSPQQLALHVDLGSFQQTLERSRAFRPADVVDALAPALYEQRRSAAAAASSKPGESSSVPFERLDVVAQDEWARDAMRLADVLTAAGLQILPATSGEIPAGPDVVARHLDRHADRLAELLHDGRVADRKRRGWTDGDAFDAERRVDPLCRPYARLTLVERRAVRDEVRRLAAVFRAAGFRLEFPGQGFGGAGR